jgi:hypothetical protein
VAEADLPEALRPAAFVLAFNALVEPSSSHRVAEAPPPRTGRDASPEAATNPLNAVAQALGIDASTAERVFDVDDEGVHIIVPRRQLESGKRPATRQLALLVIAGRQSAGLEEWTPVSVVRAVCEHYGVYDSGNFATDVRSVEGVRVRGQGARRELKVTVTAFEAAGELVRALGTPE